MLLLHAACITEFDLGACREELVLCPEIAGIGPHFLSLTNSWSAYLALRE
jgi:hypothetical protein